MKVSELAELFLLRLYDHAEKHGHGSFASLDELAAEFGVTDKIKSKVDPFV
jgi:hypothetical protein